MFWASNVSLLAGVSTHYEMQVPETLIWSYSDCCFMCTPSLRQYSTVAVRKKRKTFLHPHNKCHCSASVWPGEKQNTCSWAFFCQTNENCEMSSILRHTHTAWPSRSEKLASCFLAFSLFCFFLLWWSSSSYVLFVPASARAKTY